MTFPSGTSSVPVASRFRFSPQVLAFLVALLAAIPPLRGTIVSGVFWWWADSYAQVEYVMDEARPNSGSPYISGHLAGSTEPRNMVGLMRGDAMVVKALPQEVFAPGKTISIWHSERAPNLLVFGDEVNDIPVASVTALPGLGALLRYLAWLLATMITGLALTTWVANRWSRQYGTLPRRRSRI